MTKKLVELFSNPATAFIVVVAAMFVIALPFIIIGAIRKHLQKKALIQRDADEIIYKR